MANPNAYVAYREHKDGATEPEAALGPTPFAARAALNELFLAWAYEFEEGDPERIVVDNYGHVQVASNPTLEDNPYDAAEAAMERMRASPPKE